MAEQSWPIIRAQEPRQPLEALFEVLRRSYARTASDLGAGHPISKAWRTKRWEDWLAADFLDRPAIGVALARTLDIIVRNVERPADLAERFDHARYRLPKLLEAQRLAMPDPAPDRSFVVTLRAYDGRALLVYAADLADWRRYAITRPWSDLVKTFAIRRHVDRAAAEAEAQALVDELLPAMNRPA